MMGLYDDICGLSIPVLAGLAFLFSVGFLLQILGCALYNNWWPMLTGLMYIMLPMPCLFFGGGSSDFITSGEGGDWADAAKFLTGFSSVGSIAIPAILRHANLITAGAMWIEFAAFFILLSTVMIFQKVSQEDDYY